MDKGKSEKVEITERALQQLEQWERPIVITTDITHAVGLVAMVQLGLRHPQAKEFATALMVEKLVADLIERIDPDHGDIWKFLNMGFNPVHDA